MFRARRFRCRVQSWLNLESWIVNRHGRRLTRCGRPGRRHRDAKQLRNKSPIGWRVPVGCAGDPLPDQAIATDEVRRRNSACLVVGFHLARSLVEYLEWESLARHKIADALLETGIVNSNRHHLQSGGREVVMQRLDRRHLQFAGSAPRRPQVQQHHLATIVGDSTRAWLRIPRDGTEVGGGCAGRDPRFRQLERSRIRNGRRGTCHNNGSDDHAAVHACSEQRARNSRISAAVSDAVKTALPATNVSAPARQHRVIVSRVTPPSTSSAADDPTALRSCRARAIFSTDPSMNFWPPKPGFTDITSSRSMSRATSRSDSTGVDGLIATPARQPSSRIRCNCRCRCGAASWWIVNTFAPAPTNDSKYFSGSTTIRCTSSGSFVSRRSVSITFAPNVRFGTNRPSMTSTCIQSAPPSSQRATSSASRPKSALSTDGAMRTVMVCPKFESK